MLPMMNHVMVCFHLSILSSNTFKKESVLRKKYNWEQTIIQTERALPCDSNKIHLVKNGLQASPGTACVVNKIVSCLINKIRLVKNGLQAAQGTTCERNRFIFLSAYKVRGTLFPYNLVSFS